MSDFNKKAIELLEKLCHIKCTPEEEKDLLEKVKQVLDYVERLDEIDTSNVPPCNYVLKEIHQLELRKDEIQKSNLSREDFFRNSPEQIAGMIKVPPIL